MTKLWPFAILCTVAAACSALGGGSAPSRAYWHPCPDGEIVELPKEYFTVGFSPRYRQPQWVAWYLTNERLEKAVPLPKRRDFTTDDKAPNGVSAQSFDRTYKRRQLAPPEDFRFSEEALRETFLMSNVAPQEQGSFGETWQRLETAVRKWAGQCDTLFVVTGSVLAPALDTLSNGMAIPRMYYKALLSVRGGEKEAVGFLVKANPGFMPALGDLAAPVDRVEEFTRQDFFCGLPDSLESALESRVAKSRWGLE